MPTRRPIWRRRSISAESFHAQGIELRDQAVKADVFLFQSPVRAETVLLQILVQGTLFVRQPL